MAATEKDQSFASNCPSKEQISVYKDVQKDGRGNKTTNMFPRMSGRDNSTCTIRIRSKNSIEMVRGNVKRTISEHRENQAQADKLKEAK